MRGICLSLLCLFVSASACKEKPKTHPLDELNHVNVWRVSPVAWSVQDATDMATAFGFSGTVFDLADRMDVIGSDWGPTGPTELRLLSGTLGFGTAGPAQVNFGAACNDGADNDGDTLVDEADPDCQGSEDDSETEALGQDRADADYTSFALTTASDGTVTIDAATDFTVSMPATGGGTLTGVVSLREPGAGNVDPETGAYVLTLPFEAVVTCNGGACFAGSCELRWDLKVGDTEPGSSLYRQTDGGGTFAGGFVVAAPTACAGGADPAAVATEIGLPDINAAASFGVELEPVFAHLGPVLELNKVSGAVRYKTARPPFVAATGPPTDTTAQQIASDLLQAAGLMPPSAVVSVAEAEATRLVHFEPRVSVGMINGQEHEVPVLEAGVDVEVDGDGRVIWLRSLWRPIEADPIGVPKARAIDVFDEMRSVFPADAPHALDFAYPTDHEDVAVPYLDPLYVAADPDEQAPLITLGRATQFTPAISSVAPGPDSTVDGLGTGQVQLAATIAEGEAPYLVTWSSDVNGELGTGETIDATLSMGDHRIRLSVRDAQGAGREISYALRVVNAPLPPQPALGGPVTLIEAKLLKGTAGITYYASPRAGRASADVTVAGQNRAIFGQIRFDQFRYEIEFGMNGARYRLHSDRCVDGVYVQGQPGACLVPGNLFALGTTTPLNYYPEQGWLISTATITRVPGDLRLGFLWAAENAYAGPKGNAMDWFISKTFGKGLGLDLIDKLGGYRPGFRPRVFWTYDPPPNDELTCADIIAWCQAFPGTDEEGVPYCSVPSSVLASECPASNPNATFAILEFKAWLYTSVAPMTRTNVEKTALTKDTSYKSRIAATDGALDRTPQPNWARGMDGSENPLDAGKSDLFSFITSIARERSASFVTTDGIDTRRGDWDNVHFKDGRKFPVVFPGCNSVLEKNDTEPCMHFHTSWQESEPTPKNQHVNGYLVRARRSETFPRVRPSRLANNEELIVNGQPTPLVFWHESIAVSEDCGPDGAGIDNTDRQCAVFVSPMFWTH